jgi:hypothetical protein
MTVVGYFNATRELAACARRKAILQEYVAARKDKCAPHPLAARFYQRGESGGLPVDVVLATSMLQVGVDVSRFGLMVVTG